MTAIQLQRRDTVCSAGGGGTGEYVSIASTGQILGCLRCIFIGEKVIQIVEMTVADQSQRVEAKED